MICSLVHGRLLTGATASISTRFHRPDVRQNAPTCVGSCSQHQRIEQARGIF